jgi:hypothetical protein
MITDLADAITERINSLPEMLLHPASRRLYLPRYTLEELATLQVAVVPAAISITPIDRSRDAFEYQVQIGIQQRVEPTIENLDALMTLTEEIADAFRPGILVSFHGLRCVRVENDPIYNVASLETQHEFVSVIQLTYRAGRERDE